MYYVDEMPISIMKEKIGCSAENVRRFRKSCNLPDRRRVWTDEDDKIAAKEMARSCIGADFNGDMRSLAFVMRHRTSTVKYNAGRSWMMRFAPNATDSSASSPSVKRPTLRFKKHAPDIPTPSFATEGAAGIDLTSNEDYELKAGECRVIWTGLTFAIPAGYVGMVCPRSGLAAKHGLTIMNAPGIIDSDFNGDDDIVGVILYNTGTKNSSYKVNRGDRIAQLVMVPCATFELEEVEDMDSSSRGGFGSTGK